MPRGGYRSVSGRKKLPEEDRRVTCSIRLPNWIVKMLDKLEGGRGKNIEKALIKANKWKKPPDKKKSGAKKN